MQKSHTNILSLSSQVVSRLDQNQWSAQFVDVMILGRHRSTPILRAIGSMKLINQGNIK
jgi:hypothetical protein